MRIVATLSSSSGKNDIVVSTNDDKKVILIPPKASGQGSSVNGGELLFLSLATCFCNDVYREAARRQLVIENIDVKVSGDFHREGEPASNVTYEVQIQSDHPKDVIADLIRHVDKIAEIHNSLRQEIKVTLA